MPTFQRVLALILLAAQPVIAQTQPTIAEARALELTNVLQLGRRDSVEAFVGRNYSSQFLAAAPMTTHLNFLQNVVYLYEGIAVHRRCGAERGLCSRNVDTSLQP